MIIAYDNLLKSASLTTTSEHSSYPLENILHKWKKRVYRAEVSFVTITAEFDDVELIRSFFLIYSNAITSELRFYDASDSLVDTWNTTNNSFHSEVYAKKVEIDLTAPTDLYVGAMFIGNSLFYNKVAEQDIPLASSDVPTFSSDFQIAGREGSVIREGEITIPALTVEERQEIEKVFYSCGLTQPFYLDLWDKSPDAFPALYGVFTSPLSVTHLREGDTVSFGFREVN